MATNSASQARDLVLNSDSEEGLLEDSSDEYMPSDTQTQSDTENDSRLSVPEEPQRNTVVRRRGRGDGRGGRRGQGRAGCRGQGRAGGRGQMQEIDMEEASDSMAEGIFYDRGYIIFMCTFQAFSCNGLAMYFLTFPKTNSVHYHTTKK